MTALVLTVMAWLPGVAVGAEDSYRTSGQASGFAINIPDVTEVAVGRSEADIRSDLLAHGRGVGVLIADGSISEVTVEQTGVSERDPVEGENCATPQLPEPLDIVDVACSFALGSTTDGLPRGLGDATGLEVELTGADVAALIAYLLEEVQAAGVQEALDTAEDQVLSVVRGELEAACTAVLQDSGLSQGLSDVIEAAENESPIPVEIGALGSDDPCVELFELVADPPVIGEPTALIDTLKEQLAAALEGVSLLNVLLGGSVSEGVATAADATGTSDATGVDIALPSLNLLGNLVDVLTGVVDEFLTTVDEEVASVDLSELGIPPASELVDTLLAAVPQEIQDVLDEQDPLLRITGGKSTATAVYDRAAGDVTTDGQVQPLVLDLADTLATLLQVSDQDPFSVPEGDSVTIAEGTPLESTANLATCTNSDATEEGLEGKRISCAGLELVLLKGLVGDNADTEEPDGGLEVAGARAQAAAFGAPAPAAPPEEEPTAAPPTLPTTGGGAALIGLVAVGAALALRRRR